MTDERRNIKVSGAQFDLLRAAKPSGYSWGEFLTESLQSSTDHHVEVAERKGPVGDYVRCTNCGRSENTIIQLNGRECRDGIGVAESNDIRW